MNTCRKFKKNAKALSPVVASIILIAVTVAVSVAVAAWMGGMTIGFMGTSSVTVTNVEFNNDGTATNITLSLKNTGTKTVSVAAVRVNAQAVSATYLVDEDGAEATPLSITAGGTASLTITGSHGQWTSGNTYQIDLYDGSNQVVGSVQENAPGA